MHQNVTPWQRPYCNKYMWQWRDHRADPSLLRWKVIAAHTLFREREIGSQVVLTPWACRKMPCANWWENWSRLKAIFQTVRWKVPFPKRIILLVDRVGPRKRNCLEHQGLGMRKDFFFSLKDSLICFLSFSEIWSPVSSTVSQDSACRCQAPWL